MPASLAAPPRPPYTKRRTRSSPSSSSSSLHAALLSQAWRDLTVIRSSHASNSSSSSEEEESSSATVLNNDPEEEAEWDRLALAAENLIAQQQQQQHQSSGDLPLSLAQPSLVTLRMVETAMLAAVAGLAYTVATLLKLEGYLAYVMPLPVVVACLRNGAGAGVKTTAVAFLLLFSELFFSLFLIPLFFFSPLFYSGCIGWFFCFFALYCLDCGCDSMSSTTSATKYLLHC
jgi:hypothetical protein